MAYKGSGGAAVRQAVNFLGVSVLSGVVLAGIALPVVGAMGLGVKDTAEGFDELPGELKQPTLSQASHILDVNGGEIATVFSRDRTIVDLKDISPTMQQAIIAIEDDRFYEHGAVDLKGILRALTKNAESGEVSEGASTLTQQYVKNVFVEEAGDDAGAVAQATKQTLGRKIKELKYSIQLEEELGKKKILENYLNITFFGQQAYGVEAAAKRYFSKSAKDLNLTESALLAGVVQSPSRFDPINDEHEAKKRRNMVLQRMYEVGDISKREVEEAKKKPLGLKVSKAKNGCITAVDGAGFFCDYVREIFLSDPTFGKSKKARAKRWNEGGLTIKTTLDPKAQKSAQAAANNHVNASDPVAAAVTLVEPGTGKIRAMAQSRPYGFGKSETVINYSVDDAMGGGAGYQPGSTFKPITAAAALEKGISPAKVYPSPYEMPWPDMTNCAGETLRDPGTVPNESESEKGPYYMTEAMKMSVNTYFVSLEADTGLCDVTKMARSLGIKERASGEELGVGASFTLGVNEVSPLTMASAYAAFANRGVYCAPRAIESVRDAQGKKVRAPGPDCKRAMTEKTADTINAMLKGVVDFGTGQQAGLSDRASAGKTGTTDFRYAAWFVGYTPNMSAAVWMGDPEHKRKMIDITIGGKYYPKVYGADGPAPIWRDAVSGALEGKPDPDFVDIKLPEPEKPKSKGKPKNKEKDKEDREPDISLPGDITDGGTPGGRNKGRD
ncbi:penicillin-binding protein [Wenjunlia vitaminophila]|uniref:Penicillin-binding protein n=1 Tax=Wenjunlia vitaminophila TaxID=76728 RepID=A0A0T6LN36_WENVI|nr:transglycosylase domain-containing protein [Wenjunlia vitaminophila]KRV47555.1 penicillin-binding protein [Wenjunlia vitaminophila]